MTKCEYFGNCPYIADQHSKHKAIKTLFVKFFCEGNSSSCAHYLVLKELGEEFIPQDLEPDQGWLAKKIISSNKDS